MQHLEDSCAVRPI